MLRARGRAVDDSRRLLGQSRRRPGSIPGHRRRVPGGCRRCGARNHLGAADETEPQDPNGPYVESLKSPDGYGLSMNRSEDIDGTTILQIVVYSPCVANPADKSATWGLRAG